MSPIVNLQRRVAEKGRIRIGEQVPASNGRARPKKLGTFRFTSRDRAVIEAIAALYGGTVKPWGDQWEVVTETTEMNVLVPPAAMAFSQWYETWNAGGCTKRCDGEWDSVRDTACDCDPEDRECKITSRLNVMLVDVASFGVWRIETHGYYAGTELAGAVDLIHAAAARGQLLPARLRLERREVKRVVDGNATTFKFVVPVVDIDVPLQALAGAGVGLDAGALMPGGRELAAPGVIPEREGAGGPHDADGALNAATAQSRARTPAPSPRGWKPVDPQALPEAPAPTVAEQLAEVDQDKPRKPRKNAAEPVKPTGVEPRTHQDAATCHLCGEPYGDTPLVRNKAAEGGRYVHSQCAHDMETPADQPEVSPASQGRGGGGGTLGEPSRHSDGPGPAPAAKAARLLTPQQNKKLFALLPEALPPPDGVAGPDLDDWRRLQMLAMCAALGQPVESRTEIAFETAKLLIDALDGVKSGELRWSAESAVFVNNGTWEVVR